MSKEHALHDVRNHLYDKAENLWWWSLGLTFLMQFLLLLAAFWNQKLVVYMAGFLGLVVPLSVIWIRVWASSYSAKGDKCRRVILYAESLGRDVSPEERSVIQACSIGHQLKPAPFEGPYYSSKLEPGPRKLVDNTTESAFFTYNLCEKINTFLVGALVTSLVFLALIIYVGLILGQGAGNVPALGKLVLIIASVLLGSDFLLLKNRYANLKNAAVEAFKQCAQLRTRRDLTMFEAMQAVEDYHLALIHSPPIPYRAHNKYGGPLNEIYRSNHTITEHTE